MRLSEAIRLGSMIQEQAFDGSMRHGTCALNAAKDAIGFKRGWEHLFYEFPVLKVKVEGCLFPECSVSSFINKVSDMCWHLNDGHRWTRERIADWVQSIEDAQPAEVDTPQPVASVEVGAL